MPTINCPNCDKVTPVIPPKYLCKHCNYPLNKNANKDKKDIKMNFGSNPIPEATDIDRDNSSKGGSSPVDINIDASSGKQERVEEPVPPKNTDEPPATRLLGEAIKKVENPGREGSSVTGWLILHTEGKEPISYELYLGDNFFGTASEGYAVDIPIRDDKYVSRSHANIRVTKDFFNRYQYELFDDGSRRPQGPSLNGTYVNGQKERLPKDQVVFLLDGDTIQIGETKLVFKPIDSVQNAVEAATSVINTDYTATVILPRK